MLKWIVKKFGMGCGLDYSGWGLDIILKSWVVVWTMTFSKWWGISCLAAWLGIWRRISGVIYIYSVYSIFFVAQQPLVGLGLLIIKASWSRSDTPHSVGLIWMRQSDAETSTWQHTTLTRDIHTYPQHDLNLQSQQMSGHWLTPKTTWPLGLALFIWYCVSILCVLSK